MNQFFFALCLQSQMLAVALAFSDCCAPENLLQKKHVAGHYDNRLPGAVVTSLSCGISDFDVCCLLISFCYV